MCAKLVQRWALFYISCGDVAFTDAEFVLRTRRAWCVSINIAFKKRWSLFILNSSNVRPKSKRAIVQQGLAS